MPEIAIQCHRELKTGLFRIFYTAPMEPLSRVLGPRRQCHETQTGPLRISHTVPQVACRDLTDKAIRGTDTRFPCCATGRPDQPCRESKYSANRGHGDACWGLSDSAMGGPNP